MNIKSSLTNLAMKPIRGYKKYVSPYNETGAHCKYTPTCSLYTAESIKEYGALEGSIRGGLRILRCNEHAEGGYDPVLKKGEAFPEDFIYEHPPVDSNSCLHYSNAPSENNAIEKIDNRSLFKKVIDGAAITGMQLAGAIAGGVSGFVAGLTGGLAIGGTIGLNAGVGKLDDMEKSIVEKYTPPKYRDEQMRSLQSIDRPVASFGKSIHDFIAENLHSEILAKIIGTPVGLVSGIVIGGVAGACLGAAAGVTMGGTMGKNYMKDNLGLLPPIPGQEQLLEHYKS
jgi:putative membrane protein insertion efficiency factor